MFAPNKLREISEHACAGVLELGELAGDDRALLEAKCTEIRELLEEVWAPPTDLQVQKPRKLREAQVAAALRATAHAAYARGTSDALRALSLRLPTLCTSMLAKR